MVVNCIFIPYMHHVQYVMYTRTKDKSDFCYIRCKKMAVLHYEKD